MRISLIRRIILMREPSDSDADEMITDKVYSNPPAALQGRAVLAERFMPIRRLWVILP